MRNANDVPATQRQPGPWRRSAIVACLVVLTMSDGFDTQAIGFAGPAIIRGWRLAPAALGPILSAGLFGALAGAIVLGMLGDRLGRLRMVWASVTLFAIGMVATGTIADSATILPFRFATGIGLGGALPNLIALAAEQFTPRRRATGVSLVILGIPLGAALGGFGSITLVAHHGWQSLFVIAGAVSLPMVALLTLLTGGIATPREGSAVPVIDTTAPAGGVFAPGYRRTTLVLWLASFLAVMLTYTLAGWLPTLLTQRGFTAQEAGYATVLLNLGAVAGGLGIGRLSDAYGPRRVIPLAYLFGAVALAMIGAFSSFGPVLIAIAGAALFALGGQTGIGTLSATLYEARTRATAIGLTLAVGRVGAGVGPLLVSALLLHGAAVPQLFWIAGAEAMLIAAVVLAIPPRRRPEPEHIEPAGPGDPLSPARS